MHVSAVMARAHSSLNQGTRYKLGKGGMSPSGGTPAAGGYCDCTGFVAWCLGFSRKLNERFYLEFNGGWFETTAVWTDIDSPVGIFETSARKTGAVLVYPDSSGRQGHIDLLIDTKHVVHCSSGNDAQFGDAVQVTKLDVFTSNPATRVGWLHGLAE